MTTSRSLPPSIRSARDAPVLEGQVEEWIAAPPGASAPEAGEARAAERHALRAASLSLVPRQRSALFGNRAFFRRAADELAVSTQLGLELAGAVYAREVQGRTLLVGLRRGASGEPGRVGIDPAWGSILWHTHPGMRGSLAAFSRQDLECARLAGKPLLVVGFGGLSPDVLSTLTLPLGLRGALLSAGVKGILSMERLGHLRLRLLRLGVAARVCYPDGTIRPVLRAQASPWRAALDEMSFTVDRSVGALERGAQHALRRALTRVWGREPER